MQLIDGQERFKLAQSLHMGQGVPQDLVTAEHLYHEILNHNLGNPMVLYTLGTLMLDTGRYGMALQLLSHVVNSVETFGEAWNALGLTFKALNDYENADAAFEQAMEILPSDISDIPANRSAIRINNGTPQEALDFANMALEIEPDNLNCQFNKALALLELQQWEAWKWHEVRLNPDYRRADNMRVDLRNYADDGVTPAWDGSDVSTNMTIAVHGEQGLGDEIIFMSAFDCFRKLLPADTTYIVEPNPRLEQLFRRSWPDVNVFGTHNLNGEDWLGLPNPHGGVFERPNYKVAMGSLPRFTRLTDEDFPRKKFLELDEDKVKKMRALLPETGKLRVGIAWQGGIHLTHVRLRSMHLLKLRSILEKDVDWVSFQYTPDVGVELDELKKATGIEPFHDPALVGAEADIDDTIHLAASCDLVISVCQSVVHMCGGAGIPCWCLTPSKPAWRYGVNDKITMPWYGDWVRLVRQVGSDWDPVIKQVADDLGALIETKVAA